MTKQLDRIEAKLDQIILRHVAASKADYACDWLVTFLKHCPERAHLPRRIREAALTAGVSELALMQAKRALVMSNKLRVVRQPGKTDWLWQLTGKKKR